MADSIDRGFSVDVLSLKDITGIFSGDDSPLVINQAAPPGSVYLRSNGELWLKFGANDSEWERLSNTVALDGTYIMSDPSTNQDLNSTAGTLINFATGVNQGTGQVASFDAINNITTVDIAGTYNIIINGNAIQTQKNRTTAVYLELYVDDISVGIISNTANGTTKNDILTFSYDGIRPFSVGQELKLYSFRAASAGTINALPNQISMTLELLG